MRRHAFAETSFFFFFKKKKARRQQPAAAAAAPSINKDSLKRTKSWKWASRLFLLFFYFLTSSFLFSSSSSFSSFSSFYFIIKNVQRKDYWNEIEGWMCLRWVCCCCRRCCCCFVGCYNATGREKRHYEF